MPAAVHDLGAADQDARIDAERPAEQAENDDGSDPDAAAADRDAHTAAAEATFVAARVLDIVAAAKIIPTHDGFSEDCRNNRRTARARPTPSKLGELLTSKS